MSFDSVAKVSKLKVGNSTAKHVLLELALFENSKTGLCCPSLATLCESTELGKTAVRSAIKYLVDNKMIKARPIHSEKGNVIRTEYDLICVQGVSREDTLVYRETIQGVSDNDTGISETDIGISENDIGVYREATPNKEIEQVKEQGSNNKESSLSRLGETLPLFDGQPQAQKDEPKQAKKTRTKKPNTLAEKPDDVDEQVWNDFLTVRKAKRAPVTPTAVEGIQREAQKAGISLNDAIKLIVTRGWQAFNNGYSWKTNSQSQRQANRPLSRERMALHDDF